MRHMKITIFKSSQYISQAMKQRVEKKRKFKVHIDRKQK